MYYGSDRITGRVENYLKNTVATTINYKYIPSRRVRRHTPYTIQLQVDFSVTRVVLMLLLNFCQ